jgi:hypothetical protein
MEGRGWEVVVWRRVRCRWRREGGRGRGRRWNSSLVMFLIHCT